MKVPTMMRLDQELIDQIEAYRVKTGIKTTAEATRRLIVAGLDAEPAPPASFQASVPLYNPAAPTGSISQAKRQIMAERGADAPAAVVPYAGDLPRRGAVPKGAKGKR